MTGTILTYLKKQGDKSFQELPFNEVDALILCQFSYLKFDGLVPGVDESAPAVVLRELAGYPEKEKLFSDERYEKVNRELFEGMVTSVRFGGMGLNYYVNLIEKSWETQFSAITLFLEQEMPFLAFRGTDESLVAWKEDCNMAFLRPIPAQHCARKYVSDVTRRFPGAFMMGGHSKGGNLAIFAGMNSTKMLQRRIRTIYNMDGPGFRPEVQKESDYDGIEDRIVKLLPRSSFVGMLFEREASYRVIESKNLGLFQHDPYSWIVKENQFATAKEIRHGQMFMDTAVNDWIYSLSEEQIRMFIDVLFSVLEGSQAEDLIQMEEDKKKSVLGMISAIKELDEDTKKGMSEMLKGLFETAGRKALKEIDQRMKKIEVGRKSKE